MYIFKLKKNDSYKFDRSEAGFLAVVLYQNRFSLISPDAKNKLSTYF